MGAICTIIKRHRIHLNVSRVRADNSRIGKLSVQKRPQKDTKESHFQTTECPSPLPSKEEISRMTYGLLQRIKEDEDIGYKGTGILPRYRSNSDSIE